MSISTKNKHNHLLMFILTLGVFGILNTEMGVVGIIPIIAETFGVTVPDAGWTVSLFALIIAFSAPVVPLLFSRVNRKTVMVLALSVFVISNLVSVFTTNFTVLLITRAIPAFFHPLYVSIAFSTAASSVSREDAPKAVSKIFAGVSAGMVLGVPVTSYIASEFSFSAAMVFFTVVNAFVLLATIFLIPSMPVKERLSYGTQLSVLKKTVLWNSFLAALLMNAAMFGFYSYLSDYLITVTDVSFNGNQPSAVCLRHGKYRRKYRSRKIVGTTSFRHVEIRTCHHGDTLSRTLRTRETDRTNVNRHSDIGNIRRYCK